LPDPIHRKRPATQVEVDVVRHGRGAPGAVAGTAIADAGGDEVVPFLIDGGVDGDLVADEALHGVTAPVHGGPDIFDDEPRERLVGTRRATTGSGGLRGLW
jgi:hypothetical protein